MRLRACVYRCVFVYYYYYRIYIYISNCGSEILIAYICMYTPRLRVQFGCHTKIGIIPHSSILSIRVFTIFEEEILYRHSSRVCGFSPSQFPSISFASFIGWPQLFIDSLNNKRQIGLYLLVFVARHILLPRNNN